MSGDALRAAALAAVIVGLGLLEVVLLAGTAFAVGARRQTRALGLVAASGGSARDIRRIVLAQGLVLGALGAVGGVAVGALLAVAGRPLWEGSRAARSWAGTSGRGRSPARRWSACCPAWRRPSCRRSAPARMRAVDALAGRFRTTRPGAPARDRDRRRAARGRRRAWR